MPSPLESLCDMNVDERIVRDLIAACRRVASKLSELPPPKPD